MITRKTLRNGKTQISSSYFEDMVMFKKMAGDPEFKAMRWDKQTKDYYHRVAPELKAHAAVQTILCWKMGCQELSTFVSQLTDAQLENYVTKYVGEDYIPYNKLVEMANDESLSEEERADYQKQVDEYDSFVKRNVEAIAEGRNINPFYHNDVEAKKQA